jgi:ubiquinone/menaquinone biosynthesis C-methylase UbiE
MPNDSRSFSTRTDFISRKTTFNAASYAAFRPSYPPLLYSLINNYHRGAKSSLLDLGCGHGLISRKFSKEFDRVLATDPSPGMIKQAQSQSTDPEYKNISFREATAENLSFLPDSSVDAVVSGQAAHWFDFKKAWPEIFRVLRPGGTIAFWVYKDHVYVDYPKATSILIDYAYSMSKDKVGSYWEPGRNLVRQNYKTIVPPTEYFTDVERIEYEPSPTGAGTGEGTLLMDKRMTVAQSMSYLRTWSSVHAWAEDHGHPKPRDEGGEGDVIDAMYDDMRKAEGWEGDDMELTIEWGSALLLARKK